MHVSRKKVNSTSDISFSVLKLSDNRIICSKT